MNNLFEARYQNGDLPWDHGMVDFNLVDAVRNNAIDACRALDVGCGTGDNAVWLARQGFDVVACDLSATAVGRAKQKAVAAGVEICAFTADFLVDDMPAPVFGFVFDRGCLHSIPAREARNVFVRNVAANLAPGGLWLSLVGNADEGKREVGPPQLSAAGLVSIVEPFFEIRSLTAGHFGSDQQDPPKAWVCLMRKRS